MEGLDNNWILRNGKLTLKGFLFVAAATAGPFLLAIAVGGVTGEETSFWTRLFFSYVFLFAAIAIITFVDYFLHPGSPKWLC